MIFFDIDGTLLDYHKAELLGSLDFFNKYVDELTYTSKEFVEIWNSLAEKYFEKYLKKELTFQEQKRKRIKELYTTELSDEVADEKFTEYVSFYTQRWTAFEDVINCLELLKKWGYPLGIITNGDYEQQIEKLNKLDIRKYFDDNIFTSSEAGYSKPDSQIFEYACKRAGVRKENCYYVGDRLETDAIGSRDAGLQGIWLNRKHENNEKTTTQGIITINSLSQIKEIFMTKNEKIKKYILLKEDFDE